MIAGTLELQLLANVARLQQDMNQAKGAITGFTRDAERSLKSLQDVYSRVQQVFTGGVIAAGFDQIAKAAMNAEQAVNRLDAVVRATGNRSGFTRDQLHELAEAMAEASQFEDEDIRGAIATLLKFGNIHGETLKRALALSGDFAAMTGTDMATAADALGKAMASPAQGIERLQRTIGYLNPAQVEAIKNMQEMGDIAGAQAALMQILTEKIGGAAEAINTGYTKAYQDAKKAVGEFFETLGGTAAVTVPVQSFLKFTTDSFRDMKQIIEDGDWVQAAKFLLGFRRTDEMVAATRKTSPNADPAAQAKAEAEAKKKFDEALAKQDEAFLAGAVKRNKAAAEQRTKDALEAAEALQKAEEMFAADYAEAWKWADHYRNEEAKKAADERSVIAKAEQDANEMFAQDYYEAWKFANEFILNEEKKKVDLARDQWGGFLDGIEGAFRQGWNAFGDGAKSASQVAKDALKRTLYDWLWQAMAKPFILNIVAGGANAMGLSGLGSLATTAAGGGGNLLGSLGSIASSFAGPELLAGSATLLESLGPMLGMISTAMPYVAAAIAIYSMFAKSGGGPKEGGNFFGQYTSFGDYIGQGRVPGTDNGRFFTPSGSDSQVMGIGQGAAAQYYASAKALGLNSGAFSFGLGFDTDPRGTAPNRVSSGLVDASGRTIYGARDRDIGRDAEAITPALQLEASRMVAAALKASALPAYLANVFDGLVVETATQQQIDDAINTATALKTIFDVVSRNPMEDLATQIEAAQNQYGAALKANNAAIREAIKQFDGTAASTQKLSAATVQYYNAQLQLMAAIAQVSQQINEMFDSTFRNIMLAGLDKQGQYDFYQQDAEAARALLASANDPEMIRQLSARINQNINAAFSLLSPEEQRAMSGQFISQGTQAQTEANARLEQIQREAADATRTMMAEIRDLIGAGADAQVQAANTQLQAAAIQAETAAQGVTVRIVDSRGEPIVNGG